MVDNILKYFYIVNAWLIYTHMHRSLHLDIMGVYNGIILNKFNALHKSAILVEIYTVIH